MNIANTPGVQAATSAAQSPTADAVQISVLKKALDSQASGAAQLIEALPQLATSGSLGRNVDTYA